jgi:hypothetical protein
VLYVGGVGGGWSTYYIFKYKEEGFQYFGYDFTIPSLGREGRESSGVRSRRSGVIEYITEEFGHFRGTLVQISLVRILPIIDKVRGVIKYPLPAYLAVVSGGG